MLEPLAVDPRRSLVPAANSIASARLVFPAPAGPTSAITRVPFEDSPAMRFSLRAFAAPRVALERRSGAYAETFSVGLFRKEGKGGRYAVVGAAVCTEARTEPLRRRQQSPLPGEAQKRGLELLERANLDLANALAAYAVNLAQFFER